MPITNDNYQRAEDWLNRAKSDPNADKSKVAKVEQDLRSFYEGESSGALSKPTPVQPETRGGKAGYFYEPSLEEFRSNITNPEVQKALGLSDSYKEGYVQPVSVDKRSYSDLVNPDEDSGLPATYDPKNLSEGSSEYKKYSDYAFKKAQEKDPTVSRYSELEVTQNPFKKALGAVVKYGPSTAGGVEKTVALGIPRRAAATIAGNIPDSAADTTYDPMGAPNSGEYHPEKAERVMKGVKEWESLSPTANEIGQIGGYLLPQAPANAAAGRLLEATNYAGRNPFVKAGISGIVGSTVASGEGAAQDLMDNPNITGEELLHNTVPRAVIGFGGGAGMDLVAQGAAKAKRAFEESPRWNQIKNQKDIGGDTNLLTGIETTPDVRANVRAGTAQRENITPQDIAAQKVAPKFKESVENKFSTKRKEIEANLEEYLNRPEIAGQQESMKPVAEGILDMFHKGTFEGPVTGDIKHSNQAAVDTFKKVLNSVGEVAHMAPEEAALYAKNNNGIMMSPQQLKGLGIASEPGKVPVYVASKTNARALLEMEQMIDEKLKMAGTEGGINNPIWKNINRSVKSVRDRFGAPVPEFNTPGEPFAPATPSPEQARNLGQPKGVGIDNPPMPEALPGIGNSPRLNNNPFRPNRFDPNVVVPQEPVNVLERRNPNRPTDSEWGRMTPKERANTPITEYPEEGTLPPEAYGQSEPMDVTTSMLESSNGPSSVGREPTEFPNEPRITTPRFRGPKRGQEWLSPEERAADNNQYIKDVRSLNREFNAGKEARKRDNDRALSLGKKLSEETYSVAKKANPSLSPSKNELSIQRPYMSKEELEREMSRREWGAGKGDPDQRLTPENYELVEKEAAKRFGVKPGEADRALKHDVNPTGETSAVEDLADNEVHDISSDVTPPEEAKKFAQQYAKNFTPESSPSIGAKPGAESQLDAKLVERDIADQAKLDGVPNPLKDNSAKKPEIPTATLEDGTVVHGLSAVQRKNHLMLKELDDLEKALGTGTEESAHKRVLGYKTGEGRPYTDKMIAQEADNLGIRQQLEEIPATREYPGLRARAFGGGGEGVMNTIKDALGFRADALFGAIAGEARNPYTALPNTPAGRIQQYLFQQSVPFRPLLEQRGGLGAARFADDIADENRQNKER